MEFDDDSDAPSIMEEATLHNDDSDNSDDDNIGTEEHWDEWDGDEDPTEWRVFPAKEVANKICIDFGRNDLDMFKQLETQANHLYEQVAAQRLVNSRDCEYATECVQLTNYFLPPSLWLTLQSQMNKRLPHGVELVESREIELMFRFLFALGSYQGSSTSILDGERLLSRLPQRCAIV